MNEMNKSKLLSFLALALVLATVAISISGCSSNSKSRQSSNTLAQVQDQCNKVNSQAQITNNYYYNCTVDVKHSNFCSGNWKEKITYENGATTIISQADRLTYLMINNNFIPNVDIRNKNGCYLAPVRWISRQLGGQVKWDGKKSGVAVIKYKNSRIAFNAGSSSANINGKVFLPIAVQIVNGKMYVPLRIVAKAFNADMNYNIGIMPFGNLLISLDNKTQNVTMENAVKLATNAMNRAYKTFLKNGRFANGSNYSNKVLARIRRKIDDIKYKGDLAGYWILTGPYEILVDKHTGAMFFKYGSNRNVDGSYEEGICPVDVNDINVFTDGYFAG